MFRFFLLAIAALVFLQSVEAQSISVGNNVNSIAVEAGEVQSTVVPTGKKPGACKAGRFLVTVDLFRPPTTGLVKGRDLDNLSGPVIEATFDNVPNAADYSFVTNDHDLVTLSNGDVLYITGAASKRPLSTSPPWFDNTFRGNFGPGARSVVLVWRSTDCGSSFQFLSEMDPAVTGDGLCAFPQFRRNLDNSLIKQKPYDMGGSDGQLVKVDLTNDRVYLTFQCVGYWDTGGVKGKGKTPEQFVLSSIEPLNRSMILVSNKGKDWKSLGYINVPVWRFGIVPRGEDFDLGYSNVIVTANANPTGKYWIDTQGLQTSVGNWGWENAQLYTGDKTAFPRNVIYSNIAAHTLTGRIGSYGDTFIAFPDSPSKDRHGYRLFFYSHKTNKFAQANAILPVSTDPNSYVFHLTMVDVGSGPVLLYWYDVDATTQQATIRGRFLISSALGANSYSADFDISKTGGKSRSFDLAQGLAYCCDGGKVFWYGDYFTAGGMAKAMFSPVKGPLGVNLSIPIGTKYSYYPVWVEPDKTIRFNEVTYTIRTDSNEQSETPQIKLSERAWMPAGPPIQLDKIKRNVRELEQMTDYVVRSRKAERRSRRILR